MKTGVDPARIAELDRDIHAWVEILPHPDPPPSGPLHGVAFGAKDIFETRGITTEYGSPLFAGRKGDRDAALRSPPALRQPAQARALHRPGPAQRAEHSADQRCLSRAELARERPGIDSAEQDAQIGTHQIGDRLLHGARTYLAMRATESAQKEETKPNSI